MVHSVRYASASLSDAEPLRVPVILGTAREGNATKHVARHVVERLSARGGVDARLIDPAELPLGHVGDPRHAADPEAPALRDFVRTIEAADAFVIVTPEYNWGIPGALKDTIDHLKEEWARKPFGIVSTGGLAGGLRAADHLRQVVSGVGGVVVPAHVIVPYVWNAFGADGPTSEEDAWESRFDAFFTDVEWYARALQTARSPKAAPIVAEVVEA